MSKETIGAIKIIVIAFALIGVGVAAYFAVKKIKEMKAQKELECFDDLDDLDFDEDDFCECCSCCDDEAEADENK